MPVREAERGRGAVGARGRSCQGRTVRSDAACTCYYVPVPMGGTARGPGVWLELDGGDGSQPCEYIQAADLCTLTP